MHATAIVATLYMAQTPAGLRVRVGDEEIADIPLSSFPAGTRIKEELWKSYPALVLKQFGEDWYSQPEIDGLYVVLDGSEDEELIASTVERLSANQEEYTRTEGALVYRVLVEVTLTQPRQNIRCFAAAHGKGEVFARVRQELSSHIDVVPGRLNVVHIQPTDVPVMGFESTFVPVEEFTEQDWL